MKSVEIYEIAKKKAFSKIRRQRDDHAPQSSGFDSDENPLNQLLFEIQGVNDKEYSWVIHKAEDHSWEMFKEILSGLLKKYDIDSQVIEFGKATIHPEPIIAFITRQSNILYIVIRPVDIRSLRKEMLLSLISSYGAKDLKIILTVHDNAYMFNINHNDDKNDPSRGTDLYSIKYLFETLFGIDEYNCFKTFEKNYTKEIRSYLGYQVVKALTPNALYSFKKIVEYSLVSFPYNKYISELSSDIIPKEILTAVENQFIDKSFYKAIIGHGDFAQSFVTAEWLYDSMKSAGNIDYTAVVMGYYKAVEQLMFQIINRHVGEGRTLKKKGDSGYYELTKNNLDADVLDTTLGALIGFLKYHPNRDLFRFEIRSNEDAQEGFLNIIEKAKEDRNGYFHKDNISDWNKIEETRVLTYLILMLLLGAYEFSDQDREVIGIPRDNEKTEFYRLCEYVHYNSDQLFYISDGDNLIPVFAAADDSITFNEYGDPVYSGIYFRKVFGVGSEREVINLLDMKNKRISTSEAESYKENSLPNKIFSGSMTPCEAGMLFSGPKLLIYENGKYSIPESITPISY